jgi:Ca2+-binding EF-hand superfamily protein
MMNKMDTNKSGMIEFAEFINIVLYDPYKWEFYFTMIKI